MCNARIVDTGTECGIRYTSDKFEVSTGLKDIFWIILRCTWSTITLRIRATWGAMTPRSSYISDAHSFTFQNKDPRLLPVLVRVHCHHFAKWSCSKDCLHGCRSLRLGSGSDLRLGSGDSCLNRSFNLGYCCSLCLHNRSFILVDVHKDCVPLINLYRLRLNNSCTNLFKPRDNNFLEGFSSIDLRPLLNMTYSLFGPPTSLPERSSCCLVSRF